MKTYTAADLAEIIEKHRKWLAYEEGGARADMSGAYLSLADLRGAYLRDADLRVADMSLANLRGAYLRDADLRGAYLRDADLRVADMSLANLRGAYLRDADLRGANLSDANLRGANLSDANLRGANLSGAYLAEIASLWGVSGNGAEIKSIQCDLWPVTYTATHMQIGCQLHRIEQWWDFGDAEIDRMDSRALDWWQTWKPILKQIVETSPAVPGAAKKPGEEPAAA
ncbi:pentapeptide repeat-containing protein [Azorhizophilus paspali]|uniref:pentapeptide repeat-containing protein n=1 Tax=Azorhizophilus paspali TaxID=69963 RepID=UPI00364453C0